MLIGDTMSGKTSILDSLAAAKQRLSPESDDYCSSVIKVIINPKALTVDELYGCFNTTTFEWRDGVISNVFKNYSNNEKHDIQKWLIFDGPVDALWIESMNSVMDDNKILTLVNGDRIPLSSSMALLFEVENLAVASPATVSRAGMIYIDNNIDWRFFLQSWVQKNKVLFHDNISFFDELCEKVC
jgi:dynein heavy chain